MRNFTRRGKAVLAAVLTGAALTAAVLPVSASATQAETIPTTDTVIQVGAPNAIGVFAEIFGCNVVTSHASTLGYSYFNTMFGTSLNSGIDKFVSNEYYGYTSDPSQYTTVGWTGSGTTVAESLSTVMASGTHGSDGTDSDYTTGPDLFMGPTDQIATALEDTYGYENYAADPKSGMSLKTVAGIESAVTAMATSIQSKLTEMGETTRYGETPATVASNYNTFANNLISSINTKRGSSTGSVVYITGGSANSWSVYKTGSSFFNAYLSAIGATNAGTSSGTMTDAQILAAAPSIVIAASPALLTAVMNDSTLSTTYNNNSTTVKLFTLPTGAYTWAENGAEFPLSILWLAKKLYPAALNGTSGISLHETLSSFYTTYYHLNAGTALSTTIDSILGQGTTNKHFNGVNWVLDTTTDY